MIDFKWVIATLMKPRSALNSLLLSFVFAVGCGDPRPSELGAASDVVALEQPQSIQKTYSGFEFLPGDCSLKPRCIDGRVAKEWAPSELQLIVSSIEEALEAPRGAAMLHAV